MHFVDHSLSWSTVLQRGMRQRCPACGEGPLFEGYLSMNDACSVCKTDLRPFSAEDGPAFFSMSIVCVVVLPLLYLLDARYAPSLWITLGLAMCGVGLSLWLLMPRIKGVFIAIHWKLKDNQSL